MNPYYGGSHTARNPNPFSSAYPSTSTLPARYHPRRRTSDLKRRIDDASRGFVGVRIFRTILPRLLGFVNYVYTRTRNMENGSESLGLGLAALRKGCSPKHIFSGINAIILCWLVLLYYSEYSVFKHRIDECEWSNWENWPDNAVPHRTVFVADPQLVDPHTYPGRPWPLSSLTVLYTDIYMTKVHSRIQNTLYPDTEIFLGDLFDGGREWSTAKSQSPEKRWRKYGDSFWLREYDRFGRIFFRHWADGGTMPRVGQPGRKIIAELPGNHDLGFGAGVQNPVRDRYNAFFGEGNRVDVIGNHTFISIDSVSLSAMDDDPKPEKIWKPTHEFLNGVRDLRARMTARELRKQSGLSPHPLYQHNVVDTQNLKDAKLPGYSKDHGEFPAILLTHVPLYRPPGTRCGPLREHWPPDPKLSDSEKDDRNAIAVARGYQYQNVLSPTVSRFVSEKIGDIKWAFSGDDHDYCHVIHSGEPYPYEGIEEVTVKSISWAMGVRKPGFVMLSLWNPVDEHGNRNQVIAGSEKRTLQMHLCLLPDQLGIFIQYALMFVVTFLLLAARAALITSRDSQASKSPILPLAETHAIPKLKKENGYAMSSRSHSPDTASNTSTSDLGRGSSLTSRSRSESSATGSNKPQYGLPLIAHAGYFGPAEGAKKIKAEDSVNTSVRVKKPLHGRALFMYELRRGVFRVASVVFVWYFWLLWSG